MKHWLAAGFLVVCLAASGFPASQGPEIALVDNKLSISADSVSLARLLRLLDLATGMQSKVPADLANRNVSVKFSGLSVEDGVRKIFQGQPFDYVVIEGQRIIVTAASQMAGTPEAAPAYNAPPQPGIQQPFQPQPIEQPFTPDLPPVGGVPPQPAIPGIQGQPQQPAMIQTPFGPIANPRAGQPIQPAAPIPAPVQNNLFPGSFQPPTSTGIVGAQQAAPNPFGTPSPFGTPQNSPNNSNTMFGSPTVFGTPNGAQSR
jgi:hypothetical protein